MEENINYTWTQDEELDNIYDLGETFSKEEDSDNLPTRKNLQIPRRLFHMANGGAIALVYWVSFSHQQMIHALGTIACVLYLVEQIRINYPEMSQKFIPMTKFIMRAEEQLKESAMVPYVFAVLLAIITFPKPIALLAILTLAIADPLSAIIGIKYGKTKVVPHKTIEGSLAFFGSTLTISILVLGISSPVSGGMLFLISALIALAASVFESIPLRLDDNLTIPLFTAFFSWAILAMFGFSL